MFGSISYKSSLEDEPFKARFGPLWFANKLIDPKLGNYWVDPINMGKGPFIQVKNYQEVKKLIGNSTTFHITENHNLLYMPRM